MADTQELTPEPASGGDAPASGRDPFKAKIGLTLSALVVLGAGLAILQIDASSNESNTARETTRVAVRAMRANVLVNDVSGLGADLQAEQTFLPFRSPLSATGTTLATAAGLPAGSTQTAQDLQAALKALPDLGVGDLLGKLQTDAQRQTLKQQAMATTRITWNDRSTQYTTVIAVLAVALFLVGFGLVVEGPIRGAAYALGVGIAVFVMAWATWIYLLPIPMNSDRTIDAAARGGALAANGSYPAAIAQFDRAIASAHDYAPAFTGRARARLLEANPDYRVTRAFTETNGRATDEAAADAERALGLGRSRSLLSFGLVALIDFYKGDYEGAVAAADQAAGVNPGVTDVWLLRSAAQVALGDKAAARMSLERGLALLKGAEPSQQTRLLASTYLSYLAWVRRHVPAQSGAAQTLSDRVVSVETAFTLGRKLTNTAPSSGAVSVTALRYANGRLILHLAWRDLPKGTALSAIGYERPLRAGAWTQPTALALFATLGGTGQRQISVPLERVCKPTRVRADVFLDGARVLSRTGPGTAPTC